MAERFIYNLVRFFPWWSVPVMMLCGELWWIYKIKGRPSQWLYLIVGILLIITTGLWLVFGGHQNSDAWVRKVIEAEI